MAEEYVLKIDSYVGVDTGHDSLITNAIDQYIVDFDYFNPDPDNILVTSPDIKDAKGFSRAIDALTFYRQQHGWRDDGQPNRPLTAFTVEVVKRGA